MNHEKVNMLSTATIALVTVLATMGGLYFKLVDQQTPLLMIAVLEATFFAVVVLFIKWVEKRGGIV